jgi:hypothetical protein
MPHRSRAEDKVQKPPDLPGDLPNQVLHGRKYILRNDMLIEAKVMSVIKQLIPQFDDMYI